MLLAPRLLALRRHVATPCSLDRREDLVQREIRQQRSPFLGVVTVPCAEEVIRTISAAASRSTHHPRYPWS
jgi:hypothetical protein